MKKIINILQFLLFFSITAFTQKSDTTKRFDLDGKTITVKEVFVSDKVTIWLDINSKFSEKDCKHLGEVFTNKVYNTTVSLFKPTFNKKIDIVITKLQSGDDGLFSTILNKKNKTLMFLLNDEVNTYSLEQTMPHEFQHILSNDQRPLWVDEGLSGLAMAVNKYVVFYPVFYFDDTYNYSLTVWEDEIGNYGIAYLYCRYLYERDISELNKFIKTNTVDINLFIDFTDAILLNKDSGRFKMSVLPSLYQPIKITELKDKQNFSEFPYSVHYFSGIGTYIVKGELDTWAISVIHNKEVDMQRIFSESFELVLEKGDILTVSNLGRSDKKVLYSINVIK